jgi:hypothetical protein
MSLISGSSVTGSSAADTGYQISRSLRFNKADSAYLNRTPGTASNRKTFTFSVWYKKVELVTGDYFPSLFSARSGGTYAFFNFNTSTDTLTFNDNTGMSVVTNNQFRDFSAWYHLVLRVDTTQATAANRVRIYINGTESTYSSATYPSQNADLAINSTIEHRIGAQNAGDPMPINGYMTEINFVDGQSLAPTDFGEFNTDTGVWEPIEYTGTYGTNGFYLNFSDNASTTTLGDDFSGNGNDWTTNNFSVTAGVGNDSLVDSPTRYGTDTGAGGEVRGNYATLNPLNNSGGVTLANGNLQATWASPSQRSVLSTIGIPTSGKFYAEFTIGVSTSAAFLCSFGLATASVARTSNGGGVSGAWVIGARDDRFVSRDGTSLNFGVGQTFSSGTVLQVAIDRDNDQAWLGFDNTWINSTTGTDGNPSAGTNPTASSLPSDLFVLVGFYENNGYVNFGQRPFVYTAPSGFKALVTTNLPTPTIEKGGEYFNTVLYTGNSSGASVTGVGFQPDLVWMKCRSTARNHELLDVVRGGSSTLFSNLTNAEATDQRISSFNADGFTYTTNSNSANAGDTFVAWNWKANGAGVSNTDGTITSTVSVNTTSGFSIVTYAGNSTAGATIGHGLGVAPSMVIVKARDKTEDWLVYHKGVASDAETDYLQLNSTAAASDNSVVWNDTAPTSTVFTVGADSGVNGSTYNYVAYCFAPVAGYSAFGSYTGNGSADGPFVFTGFRPAFIMMKRTDTTGNWILLDDKRYEYNSSVSPRELYANLSNAEADSNAADILSNGFKLRVIFSSYNASGGTYIFMAFAENPFSIALAR